MSTQYTEKLRILREAADWNLCRESLSELAEKLNQDDVANIIVEQAKHFLLQYLERVPDDAVIAEAISVLATVKGLEDLSVRSQKIRSLLQDKASTPGINNYRNSMREIGQLVTFDHRSEEDIERFVNIISGIILASEDYIWGIDNRELWQRAFELKERKDYFIRAYHFVTDPQVIALNKTLWGQVADTVEKVIKQ